ncbi:MAG: phosphatidylglycerophosphatase A [Pseudomonadota bacterium]
MHSTPLSHAIATFARVGHLRPAPGTWASAVAAILAVPIIAAGGVLALASLAVAAFVFGLWATRQETGPDNHDPSEIVIDEVAGQWTALFPIAVAYEPRDLTAAYFYVAISASFALFRLFDIWKPGPVGWADRREDALGVMLDDIVAGALAALVLLLAFIGFSEVLF